MNSIKSHFPIFKRKIHGHPLVYLDNAATTQKPKAVIDELVKYYSETNANIHRGIHTVAEEATLAYEKTREMVAEWLGSEKEEIIFTKNATESINLVAYSWAREHVREGDSILLSIMEHHANHVPWRVLALERNVNIEYIDITEEGRLDMGDFKSKIQNPKSKIRLVAITHQSNILGTINPIREITNIAHEYKAKVIVDAAQSITHLPISVRRYDPDFLVFSAHKMLGPLGVGVLYAKKEYLRAMKPFLTGGDVIRSVTREKIVWNDTPWKFEAGTPDIASVVVFAQALRYLSSVGIATIHAHQQKLTEYALKEFAKLKGVSLYGPRDAKDRGGILSFNVTGVHPHDVASILDEEGIAVRSGAHCAGPLMQRLGVDATVRASWYVYNDKSDIDALMKGIEKVKKVFKVGE